MGNAILSGQGIGVKVIKGTGTTSTDTSGSVTFDLGAIPKLLMVGTGYTSSGIGGSYPTAVIIYYTVIGTNNGQFYTSQASSGRVYVDTTATGFILRNNGADTIKKTIYYMAII